MDIEKERTSDSFDTLQAKILASINMANDWVAFAQNDEELIEALRRISSEIESLLKGASR